MVAPVREAVGVLVEGFGRCPRLEVPDQVVVEAGQGVAAEEPRGRAVQTSGRRWTRRGLLWLQVGQPQVVGAVGERRLHQPEGRVERAGQAQREHAGHADVLTDRPFHLRRAVPPTGGPGAKGGSSGSSSPAVIGAARGDPSLLLGALRVPDRCRATSHGSGRGLTSDDAQVDRDRDVREAELLIQGPRRGVERVAAGADLDDLDTTGAQVPDGMLAEPAPDPLSPGYRRDSEQVDLAVTPSWIEPPRHHPAQRAVGDGRYARVAPSAGVVECRDLVAAVLLPAAMLVLEDLLAEQPSGVAVEERPKGLDEQLGRRRMIVDLEWPDMHCLCLSAERNPDAVRDKLPVPGLAVSERRLSGYGRRRGKARRHHRRSAPSGQPTSRPPQHTQTD